MGLQQFWGQPGYLHTSVALRFLIAEGYEKTAEDRLACSTESHLAGALPFPCPAPPGVQAP